MGNSVISEVLVAVADRTISAAAAGISFVNNENYQFTTLKKEIPDILLRYAT